MADEESQWMTAEGEREGERANKLWLLPVHNWGFSYNTFVAVKQEEMLTLNGFKFDTFQPSLGVYQIW